MLAQNCSFQSIAKTLGRHVSTISREVAAGSCNKYTYRAGRAEARAVRNNRKRKAGKYALDQQTKLKRYVYRKLRLKWSPVQIAESLEIDYPLDMSMRISPEAIYAYLYVLPRGELKKELLSCLRQNRKHRHKQRRGTEAKRKLEDMLSIEERPKEVADRAIPGHWEGDLIMGRYKRTALGTLVERTTRYTILVALGKNKDAESVRKAYARELGALPKEIAKTLTYDQGKEMSEPKQFTIDTGMQVYFAHPGSPWERGTNENTNGLIRQYFPKGTEFDKVSAREIKRVQRELNDRPRAVLHYQKPDEVINRLVALKV